MQLDDGPLQECFGPMVARNDLQPGHVRVRVTATKARVAVSVEDIAIIRAGEVTTVELEPG